jgi:thiol-disulfide isomerase/thioredoxin
MLSRRSMIHLSAGLLAAGATTRVQAGAGQLSHLWGGLELIDSQGEVFRLADIPQWVKLVKLWANWCSGCLAEMPALMTFAKTFDGNGQVLLISNPDYWQRDQLTARRLKLPFRLATLSPANAAASNRAALRAMWETG